MKTKYLKISMLAAVIALSSCSKDDEPATKEAVIVYDEPVALEIETAQNLSISSNTSSNLIGEFDDDIMKAFESFEGTQSKSNKTNLWPQIPTICGINAKTDNNLASQSVTYTYDFPGDGSCEWRGRKLKGQISATLSFYANLTNEKITFTFKNFVVTEDYTSKIRVTNEYNGKATTRFYDALSEQQGKTRSHVYDFLKIKTTITDGTTTYPSFEITRSGNLITEPTTDSRIYTGEMFEVLNNILYYKKFEKATLSTTCSQKGFLTGKMTLSNGKNTIVSTFESTCQKQKITMTNNGKTVVIE